MRTFTEYCAVRPLIEVAHFIVMNDIDPEWYCSELKDIVLSENLSEWFGKQSRQDRFDRRQTAAYRSRIDHVMYQLQQVAGELHTLGIPASKMDAAINYIWQKVQDVQNKAQQPDFVPPPNGVGHGPQAQPRPQKPIQPQQKPTPVDPDPYGTKTAMAGMTPPPRPQRKPMPPIDPDMFRTTSTTVGMN